MTTKPNPFLAGMRAEGKAEHTTPEELKEYEAGYMAINGLVDELYTLDGMLHMGKAESIKRSMANVEKAWARIKAAIDERKTLNTNKPQGETNNEGS